MIEWSMRNVSSVAVVLTVVEDGNDEDQPVVVLLSEGKLSSKAADKGAGKVLSQ